jgi:hypothetical protein
MERKNLLYRERKDTEREAENNSKENKTLERWDMNTDQTRTNNASSPVNFTNDHVYVMGPEWA